MTLSHNDAVIKLGKIHSDIRLRSTYQPGGKQKFICDDGHKWEAQFSQVTHKHYPTGCPACKGFNHKRLSPEQVYEQFVAIRDKYGSNVRMLSEYTTRLDTSTFRCSLGHRFESRAKYVIQQLQETSGEQCGCPICASDRRVKKLSMPVAEFKKLLIGTKNHIQISTEGHFYLRADLTVCCKLGHTSVSLAKNFRKQLIVHAELIKNDHRMCCPICRDAFLQRQQSSAALTAIQALTNLTGIKFQTVLTGGEYRIKNPNGKYFKLDGYNAQHNIAIEYHGDHWHGRKDRNSERWLSTVSRHKFLKTKCHVIVIWDSDYRGRPKKTIRKAAQRIETILQQ